MRNDSKSAKVGDGEHWLHSNDAPELFKRELVLSSAPVFVVVVVVGDWELGGDNFVRALGIVGDDGGERARGRGGECPFWEGFFMPVAVAGGRNGFQLAELFQKVF